MYGEDKLRERLIQEAMLLKQEKGWTDSSLAYGVLHAKYHLAGKKQEEDILFKLMHAETAKKPFDEVFSDE